MKIFTITFPSDFGGWTDSIVSHFNGTLFRTNPEIQLLTGYFSEIGGIESAKRHKFLILEQIQAFKPDFVFFPDDKMYTHFAADIEKKTQAKIIFTSIYSCKHELNLASSNRQIGIIQSVDFKQLYYVLQAVSPKTKAVRIIAGPFLERMVADLTSRVEKAGLQVLSKCTSSWEEYRKFALEAGTDEFVFPLFPFGAKSGKTLHVSSEQYNSFINGLERKTVGFGYGRGKKDKELLFSWVQSPNKIGENAAHLLLSLLAGSSKIGKVEEVIYGSLAISASKARQFNIDLNDPLVASFLTSS